MLRRRTCGFLGVAIAFAVLPATLVAQTRVKLQSNAGKNPLQAAIAELTVPSRTKAAQQRLWQAGEAAVPLLAVEVERDGAGEAAARFVLEQLGCEAAAAVPVLRRIVDDPQTGPARRARVAATLARIDGPPIVLVSMFQDGAVAEFDLDGNELRRVAVMSPWGAWPMPGDRLGVVSFSNGEVVGTDWQGQAETLRKLESSSGSVVALDDDFAGDVVFTTWQEKGELIRRNASGEEVWKVSVDAVRVERDFGDELLVFTREKPRVLWFSLAGEELRSLPLPEMCHNLQLLPGGGLLAASHSNKVYEFAPDGKPIGEFTVAGTPNDVVRLPDGRTLVTTDTALMMLGADGKVSWEQRVGYGGPMFVRRPRWEAR